MSRKSGYQTKIEKALANLTVPNAVAAAKLRARLRKFEHLDEIPTTIVGGDEFRLDNYHYSATGKVCELCGHRPIKRIFVIKNLNTGKTAAIGSECATNYIDADIIEGLSKVFNTDFLKIVNPIKFEREVAALEYAIEHKLPLPYRIRYRLINGGSAQSALRKIRDGKPITKKEKEVLNAYLQIYDNKEAYAAIVALGAFFREIKHGINKLVFREQQEKRRIAAAKQRIAAINRNAFPNFVEIVTATARAIRAAESLENLLNGNTENKYPSINEEYKDKAEALLASPVLNEHEVNFLNQVITYAEKNNLAKWAPAKVDKIAEKVLNATSDTGNETSNATGDTATGNTDGVAAKDLFDFLYKAELNYGQRKFLNSVYRYFKRTGYITDAQKTALLRHANAHGFNDGVSEDDTRINFVNVNQQIT